MVHRAILFVLRHLLETPDPIGMSHMVVAFAVLNVYLEAFRMLIEEFLESLYLLLKTEPVENLLKRICQGFPARKATTRLGMGCGLHVYGTPCRPILGPRGGEGISFSIYHQRFVPRHSWHPWLLWALLALCKISLPH